MKISIDEWKMWMRWKDEKRKEQYKLYIPGGITIYFPPIERTTLDNKVTLTKDEKVSYINFKQWKKKCIGK